jgi:hypothetical protein
VRCRQSHSWRGSGRIRVSPEEERAASDGAGAADAATSSRREQHQLDVTDCNINTAVEYRTLV